MGETVSLDQTVAELLIDARRRLAETPFGAPGREAHLLLGAVLGLDEAQLLAHDEQVPPPADAAQFERWLTRRLGGEPIAHLLGTKEFFGREFAVDSRVLVPRPETEHLIEAALALPLPRNARVLDVGTGSSCIAATLAAERPQWQVVGSDRSLGAVAVASDNVARIAPHVRLVVADLAAGLAIDEFDLVVSNPPYIGTEERSSLSTEILEFEPELALFAGHGGLDVYRDLLAVLRPLTSGTQVVLEHGQGQSEAVAALGEQNGFDSRAVIPDYAGIDRVAVLERR